jgi:tetratricopeptide (TPR) repeat protein
MSFVSFWAILGIFLSSWSIRALPGARLIHIKIAFVLALVVHYVVGRLAYPIHDQVLALLSDSAAGSAGGSLNLKFFFPAGLAPQLVFVGIVVFPVFLLVSLLLPYVCNRVQSDRRHLGFVYGANTLAFCVGIVVFTWITPRVSIFYSLKLMIVLLAVGVALLALLSEKRRLVAWKPLAALAAIVAGGLLTPAGFDRSYLMPYGAPARYPIRAMKSDGAHTTFVVSHESGDRLYFGNTSLSNTSLPVQTYMGLMAHVPLLAQRRPERALLICYGVGNTATAIAAHETIREIDIVELSINVIRTAPEFSAFTNEVHLDPRVRFIHDDGRNFLNVSDRRYDLITSEPPPPLHDGVFRLYSRQYYEQALAHLTPNGMMTQWLPVWQLPGAAVDLAISTFVDVFPHTLLFLGLNSEFIILGSPAPIDLLEIERRFDESDRVRAHLKRLGITSPVALFFRMIQGDQSLRRRYGGRGVIRDTHNDLAHLFVDLRQPGVIPYDPLAMLAELQTERLGVYEELRGIVTHLGRLRYHIPGFPIESLMTVRAASAREVELADVDWRAIGRIEQQAGRLRGAGSTAQAGEMLLQSFHLAQEQPALLLRLAQLYLRNGLDEDAGRAVRRFRRIEPNETIGLYNLGVVFEKQGDTHRAIASYRQALDLDPTLVAAVKHLAWMLATSSDAGLRDGNEAVSRVERLMQATGHADADVLATLAAAYAETGDFDAAVGWQTKALHLAPENRIADYRASLQRYADHESYRQDPRLETRAPWDPRFRILLADR